MKKYLPIFLLIVLVLFPFVYTPAKGVFLFVSRPLLGVTSKIISGISNFWETIETVSDLTSENERLNKEVQRLLAEKAALLEKEKENEILKKQLNFVGTNKDKEFIPAQIIGRSPTTFVQYLILNKGERDGIIEGQVVVSEGFLVGKIKEVHQNSSSVFLITNPASSVAAQTQESRAHGLIKGDIGYGLEFHDIPKEAPVEEGENVITSGLGQDYPKGILIGQIEQISSSPSELFQKASLSIPLDFFKLEYVLVIKNEND